MTKHTITSENAELVDRWLRERGGIAVWESADLGDPSWSVTTPVLGPDGQPRERPHWKSQNKPSRIITDPEEVLVTVPRRYRRVRVRTRLGSSGLRIKLTDGSSNNVRRLVQAATKRHGDAWYEMDHSEDELNLNTGRGLGHCVIYVPASTLPLREFLAGGQKTACLES